MSNEKLNTVLQNSNKTTPAFDLEKAIKEDWDRILVKYAKEFGSLHRSDRLP